MDFNDSPEEAAFRREARDWIEANAPVEHLSALKRSGFGLLEIDATEAEKVALGRDWQRKKYDAGWGCIHWPEAYGGRDANPVQNIIFHQEEGHYAKLTERLIVGLSMCAPTLMVHASEDINKTLLPRMGRSDDIWCQLFSEPGAGSDLAGIRTRAERAGDGWRINGQKIWTSGAHYSQWGLLLTRTDSELPKHKGLTMFIVRMDSPGIDVRQIRQMSEQSGFNEVFFTDVHIPDEHRIGDVNDGWRVALTTLMNERMSVSTTMTTGFEELFDFCRTWQIDGRPAVENDLVKGRLASLAVRASGLKYTAMRAISQLSQGNTPGPENSVLKLVAAAARQEAAKFALDLQGTIGLGIGADAYDEGRFQAMLMRAPGMRLEGGSDEIQRSILAERVLGMPGDPRVDKDIPFSRVPTR